ncbi:lachesin [Microplitis mediator]|uniref:lachesin n=1 Tax=Microplitis mediator TaxID=375433 RepID=UPI002552B340|nr:lachesin [Microplitis mediator]XP_057333654.1 lachesin [Microplitis mediator]XP_057333655.1 lachesin [Microplitis mediator]
MAAYKLTLLLAILHVCSCQVTPEVLPIFLAPLENHTVTQGRDVFFTCVVNHLHSYKVAWIKSDSRAILAIHTHMVTHNPRLSVTHNGHDTWKLHIANVQKNDSGTYMCQVNTDPMRSQMGYMVVQIPPDIMDDDSTDGYVTGERGNIKLRCVAMGIPQPTVTWRREDGRNITLREEGREKISVKSFEGETLNLTGILRSEMGNYLCIASNGVPPTISKRYNVQVHFQPLIKVTNQLVGAPVNRNVTLQCTVEASPRAMNTWYRDKGDKLLPSIKYTMSESALNDYTWQMNLTIHNLDKKDFGGYACASVNALGRAEASVRLQELELATETTPGPISRNTDAKVRKKINSKQKLNRRPNNSHDDWDNNNLSSNKNNNNNNNHNNNNNNDEYGTTQIMGGSTQVHRTERPLISPSLSPPWVILVSHTQKLSSCISITLLFLFLVFVVH